MSNSTPPPLPSEPKKKKNGCLTAVLIFIGLIVLLVVVFVCKLLMGGKPINAEAFIDAEATGYVHLTDTRGDAGVTDMAQHIAESFQRQQMKQNQQNLPAPIVWMQKFQQLQQRTSYGYIKAPQVLAVNLPPYPGQTTDRNFVIIDLNAMPKMMSGMFSLIVKQIYKHAPQQGGNQIYRGVPIIASDEDDFNTAFHKKVFLMATDIGRLKMNIDTLLDKPDKINPPSLLKDEIPGKWDIKAATSDINIPKGMLATNTFDTSIEALATEKLQSDLQRIQLGVDIKSADEISAVIRIHCSTPETASQCRAILKETFIPELQDLCKKQKLTLTTTLPEAPSKNADIHLEIRNIKPWVEGFISEFFQVPQRQ